jgi:hypothetical protein
MNNEARRIIPFVKRSYEMFYDLFDEFEIKEVLEINYQVI